MADVEHDLLLKVDHVKYRKAGDGRSPIGRLMIYKEYVEWRDNASPEVLCLKFMHIKGQRVSPPHKAKVQLQMILQNEDQATFVFLNPEFDKAALGKERDAVKETLQQALIAHRSRVNQLAASIEKGSKSVELEAKQKLLWQNKQLEQLYKHLVSTKLISPQDFWADYYKSEGLVEEKTGISGAFLANIAQQEGTNGVKLNLNPEIIQAIFNTYPAVEEKHLELVPHELTEAQFWSKFFQSHYFHRERDVLPNPKDPFADCTRNDDAEMGKMMADGVQRRRFDLDHLDDYALKDFLHKSESVPKSTKSTLIRRCNYLSEKILQTSLMLPTRRPEGQINGDGASTSAAATSVDDRPRGFSVLDRVVAEDECRLESEELQELSEELNLQPIRIDENNIAEKKTYPPMDAQKYKSLIVSFFSTTTDEEIMAGGDSDSDDDEMIDVDGDYETPINGALNGHGKHKPSKGCPPPEKWGLAASDLEELKAVHGAVAELCRHFWTCFPPITPDLEAKIDRMEQTLMNYETQQLSNLAVKYGRVNVEQCYQMIQRVHDRYKLYAERRKK